jgi:adenylate cyclase
VALSLDAIRPCLEGTIPSAIATCAEDGTPNVAYLSHVHYVDAGHVALSYQFFNKTRRNVLANGAAAVLVVDPDTAAQYRLGLRYLRTETAGPLFEYMKARLAGIASHVGMAKVFRLEGADVYRVRSVERVAGAALPHPEALPDLLAPLRACSRRLAACAELGELVDAALAGLEAHFGIHTAMLLLLDEGGERLYTVASRGYAASGVGSEIPLGAGIVGVAARERTPIRIGHLAREYLYLDAVREGMRRSGPEPGLETEIPLPGLSDPRSQLAVPVLKGTSLIGVLYAESPREMAFSHAHEDALVTLADTLALAFASLSDAAVVQGAPGVARRRGGTAEGEPLAVRHYDADDSVFLGCDYLIKGVAGAILWSLLREHAKSGRTDYTNRELRLDPAIPLPDLCDNLEARLILLQRRLDEREACVRIKKTGRGRFRLKVERPLELVAVPA